MPVYSVLFKVALSATADMGSPGGCNFLHDKAVMRGVAIKRTLRGTRLSLLLRYQDVTGSYLRPRTAYPTGSYGSSLFFS